MADRCGKNTPFSEYFTTLRYSSVRSWWVKVRCVKSCHTNTKHSLNSLLKISIVGGVIALLVWGTKAAQNALAQFAYEIAGYGKPKLSGYQLTIPIQIRFNNPTPLSINADQLIADIYLLKNNAYVIAARVNQPVSVPAGISVQTVSPVVDIKSIFSGNLLDTLKFVQQTVAGKTVGVKVDVTVVYQGVTLPKQTFEQNVPLT